MAPGQLLPIPDERLASPLGRHSGGLVDYSAVNPEGLCCRLVPAGRRFDTDGKRCGNALRAAVLERLGGVGEKRLGQQVAGVRSYLGKIAATIAR